jgi:iron complex outermembrane receptor protein
VVEHRLSPDDLISGRIYAGTRKVYQTLAFSGAALTSSGGVVDLDRDYGGVGLQWSHKLRINQMPVSWTFGAEADGLREARRGYVNNAGTSGAPRRDEDNRARNLDLFGQIDWRFAPRWRAVAGVRMSNVPFSIDDRYITAVNPDDSGQVSYRNTSPVVGLVWHVADRMNLYANLGTGFETPTLAETAYRAGGTGPNLALRASKSLQREVGMKARLDDRHSFDVALFDARSKNEIVPSTVESGRTIFQNIDDVRRRGAELSMKSAWGNLHTQAGYTWLDARFQQSFVNGQNVRIAAGNQLPGVPMHSLFGDIEYRPVAPFSVGLEVRAESKAYVDDVNSDAAPGYAVLNLRSGYEFRAGPAKMFLFGRIDNVLDRNYAGSVIVNDGNRRFFEPAAGRRLFIGLRSTY